MTLHTWWLYVTAVFLIAATPGPNMLHVMAQSIHHGTRRSIASMAGLMTAVLTWLFASAAMAWRSVQTARLHWRRGYSVLERPESTLADH